MDSYVYKDAEMGDGDFPNQNYIVGWVLRTVMIPNINPHQIMKTTQALIKQAMQKKQEKKVMAPVSETKDVELAQVPASQIKRQQSPGWVKQEGEKTQAELEEERRQAFKARVAAEREKESQTSTSSTVKTTRKLPTIPGASPSTETTTPTVSSTNTSSSSEANSIFCPYCGKDLTWKFCPYCGKPIAKH